MQERFKDYLSKEENNIWTNAWELTISNREVEEATSNILIESGGQVRLLMIVQIIWKMHGRFGGALS